MISVSIQIPTYKQAALIKRTIESCLMQDYKNLEIVISDDCSPDDTEEVVRPFLSDKRVKYFRNETNLGRAANYRKALFEYVKGDWVVNLDGDDYLVANDYISTSVALIEKHKYDEVCAIMHQNIFIDRICKQINLFGGYRYCIVNSLEYLLGYSNYPHFVHFACIYRRSYALRKGFYSYSGLTNDFLSIMSLPNHKNFIVTDKIVGVWNFNENSASSQSYKLKKVVLAESEIEFISNLEQPTHIKQKVARQFLFIKNYFYFTGGSESRLKSIIGLLRYPKLKPFYLKALLKLLFYRY